MVSGSEMTVRNGLTSESTMFRNSPTKAKQTQASAKPKGWMPGTRNVAIAMAIEVKSQLSIKRMVRSLSAQTVCCFVWAPIVSDIREAYVRILFQNGVRPEKRAAGRESCRFSLVVCYTATGKCHMHCFIV